jgi:sporulation protein YlmC with PRC-barrel domain
MSRAALAAIALLLAGAWMGTQPAEAQALTPTEELLGAPVFSSDGHRVGTVVDVSTDEDGQIEAISMSTARLLGLGERQVTVPGAGFTALRGAVVLAIHVDGVEGLMPDARAPP